MFDNFKYKMIKIMFFPYIIFAGALVLFFSSGCLSNFGSSPSGERLKEIEKSPNYDREKEQFKNKLKTAQGLKGGKAWDTMRRFLFGKEERTPGNTFPVKRLNDLSFENKHNDSLRIMKIGHSSVLIEIEGKFILTDPVWAERPSPVAFAGPSRFHSVPIDIEDLPELDAVLISHDHYDHLDKETIEKLSKTDVHFYIPLGVGAHFESWDIDTSRFTEYDWWESVDIADNSIRLVFTPAQHFSGRGLFNRNSTLWGSWTIIGAEHRVFFSGDSGYMGDFKEIGNKYGPFDLTMIEMGAYDRNWPDIHMTPEEAVQAHIDLRGKVLVPIHWGTYSLNIADWFEPINRFLTAARNDSIDFYVPYPGQIISIKNLPEFDKWWDADYLAK